MKTGFGKDLVVREIFAINLLRAPILGPLEERPRVVYHESVYRTHEEDSAVPGLAVDRNGVDWLDRFAGSPLRLNRVSIRVA